MDRVRFGRALGYGARQAAKTLLTAVDAATAENPESKRQSAGQGRSRSAPSVAQGQVLRPAGSVESRERKQAAANGPRATGAAASDAAARAREAQKGVRHGGRRFGQAVWRPFVRLSGVLWLEVTGVFFGIFALFALGGVWRLHGAWRATAGNEAEHRNLLGALAMLAVFGYFCVSSFVRAKRRERGR
jgi:hypothetical protein